MAIKVKIQGELEIYKPLDRAVIRLRERGKGAFIGYVAIVGLEQNRMQIHVTPQVKKYIEETTKKPKAEKKAKEETVLESPIL